MQFGVVLQAHPETWRLARRAEERGYTHAWFADTPMCCSDVYISMGLAAERTSKIILGTGVTVPRNRTAPVVACAAATLNAMAPGRVIIGVGSGHTGRKAMGLKPVPIDEMRNFVEVCRDMLSGKPGYYVENDRRRKVDFVHRDHGFFRWEPRVPVYVAAFGPRALAVAGEAGDGYITFSMQPPKRLVKTLATVNEAAVAKGRRPEEIDCVLMTGAVVVQPGEDLGAPHIVAAAGPFVTAVFHDYVEQDLSPDEVTGPERDMYAQYKTYFEGLNPDPEARYIEAHRGHAVYLKPGEERFVTPDLMRRFAAIGEGPELIEKVRALEAVGLRQIAINILPDHPGVLDRFAEDVIARY